MIKDLQKERFIVKKISYLQKRKRKEIGSIVFGAIFGIANFLLALAGALSPFIVDLSMGANIVLIIMIPMMILNFYQSIKFCFLTLSLYHEENRLIELLSRMRYNHDYSYERVRELVGD